MLMFKPRIPVQDQPMLAGMFLTKTQAALPPEVELSESELFDDLSWSPSIIVNLQRLLNPEGEKIDD